MSFIELPNGELINPDNIQRVEPLRSGSDRIHFSDTHTFDVQEEYAKVLRKALVFPKVPPKAPPKPRAPKKTEKKQDQSMEAGLRK